MKYWPIPLHVFFSVLIIASFVFPFYTPSCLGQTNSLSFDYLGIKEGLPTEGAFAILQDQQGFIWFSTFNGLVKYDGYDYQIFRGLVGDTTGRFPVGRSFVSSLLAKDGTIWFGTLDRGFSSYNPITERFTNFTSEVKSDGAIANLRHQMLMEDSQGRIWMYARNLTTQEVHLKHYDPSLGKSSIYSTWHQPKEEFLFDGLLVEDKHGRIWTHQAGRGVFRLESDTDQFESVLSCDSEQCNRINYLMIDQQDHLWVSTDQGLAIYDLETDTWTESLPILTRYPSLQNHPIYYSYQDRQRNIWIFLEGEGLMLYNPDVHSVRNFDLEEEPLSNLGLKADQFIIRPVLEDQEGLWLMNDLKSLAAFNRDFFFYEHQEKRLSHYGKTFNRDQNKPNEVPVAFLLDRSGIIWIGNLGAGINRQNQVAQRIDQWSYSPSGQYGLTTDSILRVQEDRDQQIWILGYDHIMKFDPQTSSFESYSPDNLGRQKSRIIFNALQDDGMGNLWIGSNKGLYKFQKQDQRWVHIIPTPSTRGIKPMLIDHDSSLWISYLERSTMFGKDFGRALGKIDLHTGQVLDKYEYDPEDSTALQSTLIRDLILGSDKQIWVSSYGGLSKYDPSSNHFSHYQYKSTDPSSISSRYISFVLEDSKANIWVGTLNQGLNLYEKETDRFRHWKEDDFSVVVSATEGKDGRLWFGTERGEGLFQMQPNTQKLSYFNQQDGLASDRVRFIIEDDYGYLWIPSESGVSRFDPAQKSFTVFDENDGFGAFGEAEVPPYTKPFKASNGDIWINSYTALYRVQPEKLLHADSPPPQVLIRSLKVGPETYQRADGELLKQHISQTKTLDLAYHQNDLTFEFVALHYASPSENRYTYLLENFDTHWQAASAERKVRYSGIPPGNYTFRVRASNADGVWNEEGAAIQITIVQAWWKTVWAYLAYAALLAIAVGYYIRWRTRKQEAKIEAQALELERERELSEKLKAIDELKDQFLANTSHELRTPLNGIIGLSEGVYDRVDTTIDREDLELIISSGKRLHYLVDDLLDFSKLKNKDFDLQKTPVDLRSTVDMIFRMSKPSVGNKPLKMVNAIPSSLTGVFADAHRLQQILYNLIGNAIKFTEEGEVRVEAQVVDKQIKISVIDTGTGIPLEKQESIFEEFQQADGSISRKFGGTGLGLSITKQLVELHQGEIGVDSEVGKGSTFWFLLSASEEVGEVIDFSNEQLTALPGSHGGQEMAENGEEALIPDSASIDETSNGRDCLRILIVDDEPVNQRVMKSHLNSSRFDLAFADDGDSALAIMESSPMFDLVLLDVMMPNMSGYEVCKKIREKYLPSELPVIMVTAKNQVNDLVQGLNRGANDYLAKPFSKQEFLARVKTQIDLHHIFDIADRFIPNEFIRALGHERITEVQLGDLVEQVVSVLFTDIRSYTTLSEAMTPADNFLFINGYTNRMGPVIQKHRGFVNQYLGDGIMAIFQHEADDALQAMIGMQVALREYNVERIAKDRPALAVGMGLHTGPLIMGIIGDSQRTDAATISDTVNTAARMEGLTKTFGVRILISGKTLKALKHPENYHFRYIGKVNVKGKLKLIEIYECIDGDPVEEMEAKWAHREAFDGATKYFYAKKYQEAISLTETILQDNPLDRVAQYFHRESIKLLGKVKPPF